MPFTIKENIDVAGLPTTWGLPALADTEAPRDAPVVERMRGAGAIAVGRTNLPDMALRVDTGSSLHGATLNPWNAGRTAGGSSGGEAVALVTGMSPLGLGNDIGGSLRSPASACGIASIRPSAGRVPDAGTIPAEDRLIAAQLMNVQGPMVRRVADVRLVLQTIMGAHPQDPWSIDAPFHGRPVGGPIRVAVTVSPLGDTEPAVADVVTRAADVLADAGYDVVEAQPPRFAEAAEVWARLLFGDYASILDHVTPMMGADGVNFLERVGQVVSPLADPAAMSGLFAQRDGIAREWSMFLAEHPLVLSPTWSRLPFEIGYDTSTPEGALGTKALTRPMMPANLLGLPSACVPAGCDPDFGLPVGVLLTGGRFREDLCLDAAETVEDRLALRTPIDPVHTAVRSDPIGG